MATNQSGKRADQEVRWFCYNLLREQGKTIEQANVILYDSLFLPRLTAWDTLPYSKGTTE